MYTVYGIYHKIYQNDLNQSLEIQISNHLLMISGIHETHYALMFLKNDFNLY
jgi:hypothetical protein